MTNWTNKTFETRGVSGEPNGRIIRVWEQGDGGENYEPRQVYVTTLLPGATKGPHLHRRRDSLFCCIHGAVQITVKTAAAEMETRYSGGVHGPVAVRVLAGESARLKNMSMTSEALVVNCSSGIYDPSDEHEVDQK